MKSGVFSECIIIVSVGSNYPRVPGAGISLCKSPTTRGCFPPPGGAFFLSFFLGLGVTRRVTDFFLSGAGHVLSLPVSSLESRISNLASKFTLIFFWQAKARGR